MDSTEILGQEKAAWLNYKGYVLVEQRRLYGYSSVGYFCGNEHSHELWATWMRWREALLDERPQHYKHSRQEHRKP